MTATEIERPFNSGHPAKPTSNRSVRSIAQTEVPTRLTCGTEDSIPTVPETVGLYAARSTYGYSGNSQLYHKLKLRVGMFGGRGRLLERAGIAQSLCIY